MSTATVISESSCAETLVGFRVKCLGVAEEEETWDQFFSYGLRNVF